MAENKAFKKAGIKNLMQKNYKINEVCIDLESEIDDKLTMKENWFNLKKKVMILWRKY